MQVFHAHAQPVADEKVQREQDNSKELLSSILCTVDELLDCPTLRSRNEIVLNNIFITCTNSRQPALLNMRAVSAAGILLHNKPNMPTIFTFLIHTECNMLREAYSHVVGKEECDAGTVVDCQVENHWQHDTLANPGGWMPCNPTCGEGHSFRTRHIRREACNGGTSCPPLMQRKVCMDKV